jgi:hypothetical protein
VDTGTQRARCVNCRVDIVVPDSYAHGDHIKCGQCGTKHKVARGEVLRLVIADTAPLKEALANNRALVERMDAELAAARASLGIGVNGIGLGVAYLLWQVGFLDRPIARDVFLEGVAVAIVTGLMLELANYLFLAKRQKMSRLSAEIVEARQEGRQLEQKIREASKV